MWIWLLGVALFSLLVAVAALMQAKRSAREAQDNEQRLNQRIEVLEKELSAMMDGAFGVANQLQKVESNLKSTVHQQEQMQQRDMGNLPYNDAVHRVSKGADVDELVEHCGLSRSEAELVEMLHKKSSPPVIAEGEQEVATAPQYEQQKPEVTPEKAFELQPGTDLEEESLEPELSQPEDDDEPLFSGDLGGEDFQQALERAREFQTPPIDPSKDKQSAASDPDQQSHEPDEGR
jgi:TolA-binding protein